MLLRPPGVPLFGRAVAARADVRVGVPHRVRHATDCHVSQRRVARGAGRADPVREPARAPGDADARAADRVRESVAAGRAARLGVPAGELRAGEVAVRQRAVRIAAVLGDVRGQDHVPAADRGCRVQNRRHRADQLPPERTGAAHEERPVPGRVQTRAEPGETRAGRCLRAGRRLAGQFLRDRVAGNGTRVARHRVLHRAFLVRRQLQFGAARVQPVPDAHGHYVHGAGRARAVRGRVVRGRVPDPAVPVVRPVQGTAVRVDRGRGHRARRAPVDGGRIRDTDQR